MRHRVRPRLPRVLAAVALCLSSAVVGIGGAGPAGAAGDPSVTINQGAAQDDPTTATPIGFDVVFSEPVTGFDENDVVLSGTAGATTAHVSADSLGYAVNVTGMTTSGTVIASIPAGAATSVATSQNSTASTSTDNSVTFNQLPPSVTINQDTSQADPASTAPIVFDVVFSEPVTGFGDSDGDLAVEGSANPTAAAIAPRDDSGTSFTVRVSGMTASGTVIASVPDGAAMSLGTGAPSAASTSIDDTVSYNRPFTVKINLNGLAPDGTSVSPIEFDVLFSDPATGFDASDIVLSGTAGASTATVTAVADNTSSYVVEVSGMTASGTVIADVRADAATSIAGDPSPASTSTDNSVVYDSSAPSSSPPSSPSGSLTPTCTTPACSVTSPASSSASTGAVSTSAVSTSAVSTSAVSTSAASTSGAAGTTNAGNGGALASTGAASELGLVLGLLLVIGGAGLALAGRRATRQH